MSSLRGRQSLKKSFAPGALITGAQFQGLIDSTFNMNVEGFNVSPEYGFEVSTQGASTGLFLFLQEQQVTTANESSLGQPVWSMQFNADRASGDDLHIVPMATALAADQLSLGLALRPSGKLGVRTMSPACEVDVHGTMRSSERVGDVHTADPAQDEEATACADGRWHTITPALTGCQSLEVVAGVGRRGSGRYALLHAVASNAYNPIGFFFNFFGWKNRIACQHAYYRSRLDKLALRWTGRNRRYFLQIRSNSDYGAGASGEPVKITYHITSLWTDPRMLQSRPTKIGSA
ncbi:MAG: hypothetical protein AB8G16_12670 [Gammaproteobacteria bacterium]